MLKAAMKPDKIGAIITILFGILSMAEAMRHFPNRMSMLVGDHTLPALVGIALIVLGIVLLFLKGESFRVEFPKGQTLFQVIATLVILFIYWFLIPYLGYTISTLLVLISLFKVIGSYGMVKSIAYGVLATTVLYLLFMNWLQIPFPNGIFGF